MPPIRQIIFVGTTSPSFSWKLKANPDHRATTAAKCDGRVTLGMSQLRQTAYIIEASEIPGDAVIWSTGWVASSETVNIMWNGTTLWSNRRFKWTLRVRDASGAESDQVNGTVVHVGLLREEDWGDSKWIVETNSIPSSPCAFYTPSPPPLMRTEFAVSRPDIVHAVVHSVGLGWHELRLNGARVGLNVLDTALTSYNKTVLYSSHDVTNLLRHGNNAIGVEVGNGWWNPNTQRLFGSFYFRQIMTVGPPRARVRLTITYADGTNTYIGSDPDTWECAAVGPRTHNHIYFGEAYDARLEDRIEGWDRPDYTPARNVTWNKCMHADDAIVSVQNETGKWIAPTPQLQFAPPVRITARWHPVASWMLEDGGFVLDFGQELTGWLEFTVPAGVPGEVSQGLLACTF